MDTPCPCCGRSLELDVPHLAPKPMRMLLAIHRAGATGISAKSLQTIVPMSDNSLKVQISKLRVSLKGSKFTIETNYTGQKPARYCLGRSA